MIGKALGHYQITSQIGKGGMGEVYLADDLNLNRKVALKFLPDAFAGDSERMARFEREAKLLASLNHPGIAAIHGLENAEGKRFIVMELVEGETLEQRLIKGPLPLEEALGICRQIAEALEAAHEKGVIHRDLKPANVMIAEGEKVKILDFGLAKALSGETQSTATSQSPTISEAMTQAGVILGTAAYMSPEQAKGKSVDKRADIWAFGCILYQCLAGKRIFEGETVTETLAAVLKNDPDLEKMPEKVRPLLRRCLERDPKKRLRDIGDAMSLLEIAPESAPARRTWLAWAAVAAVFVVTTLVVSVLHFREKAPAKAAPVRFQIPLPEKVSMDWGSLPVISPDGRHLAFSAGLGGNVRLWVRDLDSLEARPLTGTESDHIPPFFWSPDSRFIAWGAGGKLKKIDIAGGPAQTICDIGSYAVGGTWNRDDVIIFAEYLTSSLKRVSAAGGIASPLVKPDSPLRVTALHAPTFLPDGQHFLYMQDSNIPKNRGVYVGSLDFKPEEQGSRKLFATEFWPCVYVPSQDSGPGYILFPREQTLMAQRFDDKRLELFDEPRPVAEHIGSYSKAFFFSASTNGILVYQGGVEKRELVWMDRSGKPLETVGSAGEYGGFRLSPDEKSVVFSRTESSNEDIYVLDLRRRIPTRLTFNPGADNWHLWSTDGLRVVWSSFHGGNAGLYRKAATGVGTDEYLVPIDAAGFFSSDWSGTRNLSFM
jgi:eukaryotic-like serine/threonine-protein kinase